MSTTEYQNYRTLSKGKLTIYGHSVKIEEEFFALNDRQKKEKAFYELFHPKNISLSERYDMEFQEHVLKYGHDFEKHNFEFLYEDNKPPTRKKGDIKGFSKASRRRLLRKTNRINPERTIQPYHLVLTYPNQFPENGIDHKKDLDRFFKRLKHQFGEYEYLWRLEFQKRKAPHYHILVYFSKQYKVEFLRHWLSKNWFEVVQRDWSVKDEKHLKVGTSCDLVKDINKAGSYLTKYISKEDERRDIEGQGRHWGCSRNWGDTMFSDIELTGKQLIEYRRLLKRYLKGNLSMSKIVTKPINIEVWAHWRFLFKASEWVKQTY